MCGCALSLRTSEFVKGSFGLGYQTALMDDAAGRELAPARKRHLRAALMRECCETARRAVRYIVEAYQMGYRMGAEDLFRVEREARLAATGEVCLMEDVKVRRAYRAATVNA